MFSLPKFIDSGLDPETAQPALLQRVRVLNLTTASMVVFAVPFLVFASAIEVVPMQVTIAGVMLAAIFNLFLLRATLRTQLCGHLACMLIMTLGLSGTFNGGGFHAPGFSLIYLLPIASAVLVGSPALWGWVGIALATAVGFWSAGELGVIMPNTAPVEVQSAQNLVTRLAAIFTVGIFSASFISIQRRLEADLERRSYAQHTDAESLRLLHDATIAANESETIEEVLRQVLELVRARGGWDVGHVLTRADDDPDQLVSTGIWSMADPEAYRDLVKVSSIHRVDVATGMAGRALATGAVVQSDEIDMNDTPPAVRARLDACKQAGLTRGLAIPISAGGQVDSVIELVRKAAHAPSDATIDLLCDVASRVASVIERRRADQQIHSLAFYDVLTGLPNRLRFQERLGRTLIESANLNQRVALLFVDLDGFKNVNDTLGHAAGDQLLFAVAHRFMRSVRLTDSVGRATGAVAGSDEGQTISRLGGDEFTVLLTEVDGVEGAARAAERLLQSLSEPIQIDGQEIFATASIGISLFPDDASDAETLVHNADSAMYHAKNCGRNNYQFFTDSLSERGTRRGQVRNRLSRARERGDFSLAYQPIREAASGRVTGLEALLRWWDEELGQVSPAEFIEIAEESGLIPVIGEWVFETACTQLRSWVDAGYRPLRLALNVSGRQVRQPGMVDRFAEILANTGCSSAWLELELTESTIMQDDDATNTALAELSGLGLGLSLDDFGTGYSSLSYLKRFPIDRVKIDRSFVADLPANADDVAIVSAIVAMAHSLRLRVVAEGVETEEQMAFLRSIGCDELQGHLFSPAVPAEEFERFLEREKPIVV